MAAPTTPANHPPDFSHLDSYLDSLAAATMPNQPALARLIEANAQLTATVKTLTANNAALTAAYSKLVTTMPHTATLGTSATTRTPAST